MNKQALLLQINSKLSKTIATIDHHAKQTLLNKISVTLDHAVKTLDDKWITMNGGSKKDGEGGGSKILLDDNGHIKAGAGGKFNGQKLSDMGGTQKFTKYQTNAERSGKTKKEKELHQVRNSLMMNLDVPQEYKFTNGGFHQLKRSINDGSLRLLSLGSGKNKDEAHFKSLHEQLKRERDIFNYVKDHPELHNDFDIKKISKDDVKKMMQGSEPVAKSEPSQENTQGASNANISQGASEAKKQRAFSHSDEQNVFGEKHKKDIFGRREEDNKRPDYDFSKMDYDFTDKDMNKIKGWRYKWNNDTGNVMIAHESNEDSAAKSFKNMDEARAFVSKKEQQKEQAKKYTKKVHKMGEDILTALESGKIKTKEELKSHALSLDFNNDAQLRDDVQNYLFKNGLGELMNNLSSNAN